MYEFEIPEVNPYMRKIFNAQYKLMYNKRNGIKDDLTEKKCVRCKKMFPASQTIMRKYSEYSTRTNRFCFECDKELRRRIF